MTNIGSGKGLVSWSGTMFEYFMPLLIMKNYPDTLLNETYINVIKGQKDYAKKRHMPFWGISESAFYSFDIAANYQYKAFGVPGIGLKRGLINEVVISPYSTILAMQKDLYSAIRNLNKIIASGMEGKYGFYEAMDCTNSRMPKGMKNCIIKCFMVHHEGMSLLALDNVLKGFVLQNRFHKIPRVKSTELLLQERVPKRVIYDREQIFEIPKENDIRENLISRHYRNPNMEMPESDILSNGIYSTMITDTGSGYGKKDDMMIYRWKGDSTEDDTGMFFYIKDISTGKMFSATYEPCKNAGDSYETTFSLDKAEFKRKDGDIETKTEVAVSNEDNAEVRRITIKNTSKQEKSMEITSYCEVTLANLSADEVHPAFSNLFIRTEFLKDPICILANRRPRAKNQDKPWLMQTIVTGSETIGDIQYETRREEFLGRNGDLILPKALKGNNNLKNSSGDVIDPIISFRIKVKIPAESVSSIAYISSISKERQDAIELAKKYSDMQNVNGIFNFAPSEIHAELNYLGIKPNQANLYQLMASKILFLNTMIRERSNYIENVKKSQSALWSYGISGDLPIVLLIVRNESDIGLVKQMVNAHEYWAMKGLKVDLVILDMKDSGYLQEFNNLIRDEISSGHSKDLINKSAGIFLYEKSTMDSSDIELLMAIARLVVDSNKGLLVSQVKSSIKLKDEIPYLEKKNIDYGDGKFAFEHSKLSYYNGYGGFDTQKDEYVIRLNNFENTPAPWLNVISNKNFGFHVSETGSAYTWCENSRENKITPWSNDYITDRITEALYLRDEDTGEVWSITPKPVRDSGEYIVEHGKGYTNFKHVAKGILGEMTMFVPMEENLKIIKINLKNISKIKRNISLTYYAQLVLGVVSRNTEMHIVTNINTENEFIYARNPYSENFGNMYAYMKIFGGEQNSFTGNRREFIGRDGSAQNPHALLKKFLTGNCGAGLDPCMAENSKITIGRGEEKNLYVILGEEDSLEKINSLTLKYSKFENVLSELSKTKDYWRKLLNKIRVKTPDESMNIMINGWLMYQTLSCRIWARTAFYQSGGAYGFRDQLQDVMSLCFLDPEMTRKQIIVNASRQFLEGDVQHWWHPVVNSGIRTRFSDDLLWLPYVTDFYIRNTGDYSILDETVNYLEDSELKENEDERYSVSKKSEKQGTIYEHCVKAIEKGLKFGIHNIPLMGSGDWNDGMSTVGNKGKGESVWLGWFLYSILNNFKNICRHNGDEYRVQRYTELGEFVKENVEKNAWDGKWYRRAYFDDGMPLGSSKNDECRIDSLAQSWAVISKGSDIKKAKVAMESVEKYLVKEDKKMVLLLTPAFNNSKMEPGYIKGYIPGVRENGGQYTHAATWVILAMAKLKEEDKAWKTFNMINPINHAKTKSESDLYKVEPYVMAADVYAEESNSGRGGWTWYTGTAGWMYRVGIEDILGLTLSEGKGFEIHPCVPHEWKEYEIDYTHENCEYKIKIERGIKKSVTLDGEALKEGFVPYLDGGKHEVKVTI
ncbi:MAG: glucoamylase family protein [Clostridium sp.]|nr:glucoamylase family protein [Clostridium sp.]